MTTPRRTASAIRFAPCLAFLLACAALSSRSYAGCAHPAGAILPARSTATLEALVLGRVDEPTAWATPGGPCHGPHCRSKAPTADAPSPSALPARPDVCLDARPLPAPAPAPGLGLWEASPCLPLLASSPLERPPRHA